jgi:DNA ligase-1
MRIKDIFDEIAEEGGSNAKMDILREYKDVDHLKEVLYLAKSKKIKFFLKQIPEYKTIYNPNTGYTMGQLLAKLADIYDREFTGGSAIKWLTTLLTNCHPDDANVIERIVKKDLKIGMGTSNINKVFPKLIEKTHYMGAKSFSSKLVNTIFEKAKKLVNPIMDKSIALAISEVKADGRYCNAIIRGGELELVSRQGEDTLLGGGILLEELSRFEDCVLNGELVIDGIKREISNGLITSIISINQKFALNTDKDTKAAEKSIDNMFKKHGLVYSELLDRIRFIVWDIIDVNDYYDNLNTETRVYRLSRLENVLDTIKPTMISLVEYRFVTTYEEAIAHFAEMLERGEEGTVLKSLDGVWKSGKHTYQIKMKVEFDLDLKIVGFNYGNEGTKNENVISSVTCESSCGTLSTRAQGIPEDLMEYITENQDTLLGTIIEVKCNGLSSNRNGGQSVLYPTLKLLRDDKTIANSFEECLEIDAGAKGLQKII